MKLDLSDTKSMEYLHDTTSDVVFANKNSDRSIRLSPTQMWQLYKSLETIDSEADTCWAAGPTTEYTYSHHLGWEILLTVMLYFGQRYYDIRRFWIPKDETAPKPTKSGIRLNKAELDQLICFKTDLFHQMPELAVMQPCHCFTGLEYMQCRRCNPQWYIFNA